MTSSLPVLNISEAKKLLKRYSLLNDSPADRGSIETIKESDSELYSYDRLRQALQLVAQNSEYQILGICAKNAEEGLTALREYCQALGYEPPRDLESIASAVYIKFNPTIDLRYMSAYEGRERGVLVSCQSPNSDGINEMYGHLPIDLFSNFTQDKT
ncbi:MAG TPA: DUF1824 family protein [Oscillatoriales cyanobacterium M59_W2019_021]|nr:MAG: DUF1824 family protein [Cyanobacteria bacterium J055]HIK32569.1 DUF1824 family protein [Oscillatoriales cyanobacterium M4454_W2019_049]HIK52200.1 DUF1824 family protein [Oscillatoriales cyanobacterium M59_W2019_021]